MIHGWPSDSYHFSSVESEIRKVPQDSPDGGFDKVPVLQKKRHVQISGKLSEIAGLKNTET
jgi:hypothetical protein